MVDPGQLPADPELHAVGVVDPDDLGCRGQAERNIKAVSLEQHLYTQRSSHEVESYSLPRVSTSRRLLFSLDSKYWKAS